MGIDIDWFVFYNNFVGNLYALPNQNTGLKGWTYLNRLIFTYIHSRTLRSIYDVTFTLSTLIFVPESVIL